MPKNKRYVDVAKRVQSIVEDYDNRSPQNYLSALAYSFNLM